MPVARAAGGDIACEAWVKEVFNGTTGKDKLVAKSRAYTELVKTWLLQHPDSVPLFRTTLTYTAGTPATDVLCVRTP